MRLIILNNNDFLKHKQANINVESRHFDFAYKWGHGNAETLAFSVNIRLFRLIILTEFQFRCSNHTAQPISTIIADALTVFQK